MAGEDSREMDPKAIFAVFALVLTIGAGGFYHLSNQLADKAEEKELDRLNNDKWSRSQMEEYRRLEDERHDIINQRLDRLETLHFEGVRRNMEVRP